MSQLSDVLKSIIWTIKKNIYTASHENKLIECAHKDLYDEWSTNIFISKQKDTIYMATANIGKVI